MTLCKSEPASGSVRSIDIVSPAHTRGMKRLCWSSSPNSYNVSIQSWAHIVYGVIGKFNPLYLRGIVMPFIPALTMASRFSTVPLA